MIEKGKKQKVLQFITNNHSKLYFVVNLTNELTIE